MKIYPKVFASHSRMCVYIFCTRLECLLIKSAHLCLGWNSVVMFATLNDAFGIVDISSRIVKPGHK